jgi:hypothetical protein
VQATEKNRLWTFPPPEQPPVLPPDMSTPFKIPTADPPKETRPSPAPLPPAAVKGGDPAIVLSMVEEKFSDLSKRLGALEHPKAGAAPSYLDPLLKRVQEMEAEMKNLKFAFTQLASAQNAVNINEITAKIMGIQKVLENLTGGTDISKPS